MKEEILIGRERECEELKRCMESGRSEFVIVYGRRRVGKTFLIDKYFGGAFDFTFVGGHGLKKKRQLQNFAKALRQQTSTNKQFKFDDWFDAFEALENHLDGISDVRKKVVFVDEMPWIDTQKSEFVEALENFWNGWAARRNDIMFIASGSASSWMMDKLVDNKGGLHARITNSIYLRPFNLNETEKYLRNHNCYWDRYQILQCYMLFGGVPFYLSLLDGSRSLIQNVDELCFRKNGALRIEFEELYSAVFSQAGHYISIVKALAGHREGMCRNDISKIVGVDGGVLTRILRNLVRCDFVSKSNMYGGKTKDSIYRLTDFYTLFYYKFIDNDTSGDEHWWSHNFLTHSVESWMGVTFELLCMMHSDQIKKALGISGISTNMSSWRKAAGKGNGDAGSQIDLIFDRSDRMVNLCEMKFSRNMFVINRDYEEKLRERMELFKQSTRCRKSIVTTFVTTFGVAQGIHSGIVNSEVKMDELFE
ncbi:MAG: ATP-binding protein [Bacteroidales bacterium]|nr:ATP-binding protein [Bacteroidales bacterium]